MYLFSPEEEAVGDGGVGVLYPVVEHLCDVLLADPVDQQRGGKGEERQEGAARHNNWQRGRSCRAHLKN